MRHSKGKTPLMREKVLPVGAEVSLSSFLSDTDWGAGHDEDWTSLGTIKRSDKNTFHLQVGKAFRFPLYYYLKDDRLFVGQDLSLFPAVGADTVDCHYLIEIEYFGFSIERKSLLQNVKMLFPEDDVVISARELFWLSAEHHQSGSFDAALVTPEEATDKLFNSLPEVTSKLFSPVDTTFYAHIANRLAESSGTKLKVGRQSLPLTVGYQEKRAKIFNKAHKNRVVEGIDLQSYTDMVQEELDRAWQDSESSLDREHYIFQTFYLPFAQFLLNILAMNASKMVEIVEGSGDEGVIPPALSISDKPICNIYESFQRVFFYGHHWLAKVWFYIPPMISSAAIKQQQKYSEREQHVCVFTLTLDYLLRFNNLKIGNVTGE
ncbi:hypothetical protein ACJJIE_07585 [Microbulbifer sp. TRSA001]|uniref:hypothetical protein n=1 Tax=Microbulbifer sp. TRSA001 TaxID=3243381 RepID=UPI0040399BF5